ncbi:MAG TPA: hypothetical protein G4O02_08580 [Caldilineae bacterium]|nr:hypothetical protein [Caldilineae bacterium]
MCAEEVRNEAEFDFADWLAEGIRGIRHQLRRKPCRLLPEAFWEHARASQREALLAIRSLFDAAIECLQPAEVESQPSRRRRSRATKIEVQ